MSKRDAEDWPAVRKGLQRGGRRVVWPVGLVIRAVRGNYRFGKKGSGNVSNAVGRETYVQFPLVGGRTFEKIGYGGDGRAEMLLGMLRTRGGGCDGVASSTCRSAPVNVAFATN